MAGLLLDGRLGSADWGQRQGCPPLHRHARAGLESVIDLIAIRIAPIHGDYRAVGEVHPDSVSVVGRLGRCFRERFSFEENLRATWSLAQECVGGLGLEFKAGGIPFSLDNGRIGLGADEAIALGGVVIDESAFEGGWVGIDCGGESVPTGRDQYHLLGLLVGDLVAFWGGW